MSWLFEILLERINEETKEITTVSMCVEGHEFSEVAEYAETNCRMHDDEIVSVRRVAPICGHVERKGGSMA